MIAKLVGIAFAVSVGAKLLERFAGAMTPVVIGLVVVIVACRALAAQPARSSAGAYHSHNTSRRTATIHEAGHVVVGRRVGGRVTGASVDAHGGGETWIDGLPGPVEDYAVWRAGEYASRTGAGCSSDRAGARRLLRTVPARDRGQVRRDGDRLARDTVRRNAGAIRRTARRLDRDGHL